MWFVQLFGVCIGILMITGTVWAVVFAIGLIKLMIQDLKKGNIKRW